MENGTRPQTDEALIQSAHSSCRGTADLVVNSPLFDGVTSWVEFKEPVRLKFRGTFSSTDFFRHLNNYKLAAGQAPADYFVSVETTVFQGVRDYPRSLSCPEEVIRCIFLQGLPSWLGEAIILKEESLLPELVEVAQKCWGLRNASFTKPQNAARNEDTTPHTSTQQSRPSCTFHKSRRHNTRDCRERFAEHPPSVEPRLSPPIDQIRCYKCNNLGHYPNSCPFSRARGTPQTSTPRENQR